jgi:hypothetical protein
VKGIKSKTLSRDAEDRRCVFDFVVWEDMIDYGTAFFALDRGFMGLAYARAILSSF